MYHDGFCNGASELWTLATRENYCFLFLPFCHVYSEEKWWIPVVTPALSPCSLQISEIYVSGESGDLTAKEKLLIWSQQATEGYPGLRCVNFTSSWSDGRMFNALLHRYR